MYTAIKARYDRKSKTYGVEVIEDANPLAVHHGFLVYEDVKYAVSAIESGKLIPSWKPQHREAVLTHLRALAHDPVEAAAKTAWDAMSHPEDPMPAGVALDFVQDQTGGDRDAAWKALREQAAVDMEGAVVGLHGNKGADCVTGRFPAVLRRGGTGYWLSTVRTNMRFAMPDNTYVGGHATEGDRWQAYGLVLVAVLAKLDALQASL